MSDPSLISLVHLGCARNLIDSELILARMAEEGLGIVGAVEDARTVVVNTCSFIGPASEESEAVIRDMLRRKERGELDHVVVAGCLVQRYKRKLQERFEGVDLFAEISDYRDLARNVAGLVGGQGAPAYLAAGRLRAPEREGARLLATPKSYAYLRISHGCDHACSFCTIPSIRGPHRSKRLIDLVSEAEELVGSGARELVLVAEDSTAWGRDMGQELPQLVEALAEVEGLHWLRVMYAYPNNFPWDLTRLLREHPRVAAYLDIPVQHAATPMLRAMRRAGTGRVVRETLERLQGEVPGITLRTTLLLGFPGETEADVQEVIQLVRDLRLSRVGAFTYSPEPGTPGYELEGRVPAAEAQARHEAVLAARDEVLREEQQARVGSELEVLVDEPAGGRGALVARAELDAPEVDMLALVVESDARPGDILRVRVEGLDEESNLICRPLHGVGS